MGRRNVLKGILIPLFAGLAVAGLRGLNDTQSQS